MKKYINKGAFLVDIGKMIVVDEEHLDDIQDLSMRESIRRQLEVSLPPAPGKVLIKVDCIGVCGSDVHYFQHGKCGTYVLDMERDIPYMLGHELSGTIVEVGQGVDSLSVGDRVCCEPGRACGKCEFCLSGRYNLCPDIIFWATPPVPGCNKKYVEFDADLCFKLGDNMSAAAGAMIEPFAIGMFAVETGEISEKDSVLIMGSGSMGLVCLLAARYKKAKNIIVCDLEDFRLEKAKELGATHVINNGKLSEEEFFRKVSELTNGGPNVVIETAGNKHTIRQSGELARRGGIVVLLAMADESVIPFNISSIKGNEVQIRPIFRYRYMFPQCVNAASDGIPVESIISDFYNFDDIQKAYDDSVLCKDKVIKAAVIVD